DDPGREPVPVVARPAELPGGRAEGEGGVGDPRADDDVGPAAERLDDAPGAEVRVRRHDLPVEGRERGALVEMPEVDAAGLEVGGEPIPVEAAAVRDPEDVVGGHGTASLRPARLALLDEGLHALGGLLGAEELAALRRRPAKAVVAGEARDAAHELLRLAHGVRAAEAHEPDHLLDGG